MKTTLSVIAGLGLILGIALNSQSTMADEHQRFFTSAEISSAQLSPNGEGLVYAKEQQSNFELYLRKNREQKFERVFSYKDLFKKKGHLASMIWVDDRYIAISVIKEILPIAQLDDTKYKRKLLFIDTQNLPKTRNDLLSIKTKGRLINPMQNIPGKVLYARTASVSRAYELEIAKLKHYGAKRKKTERLDGGQFSKDYVVAELDGYVYRWFSQGSKLVGALKLDKDGKFSLEESSDGGNSWSQTKVFWKSEKDETSDEEYSLPVDYAGEPGKYYVSKTGEDGSDTLSLHDYGTDTETMLYQSGNAKINRIETGYNDKSLRLIVLTARGEPVYIYYKGSDNKHIAAARRAGVTGYIAIVSSDLAGDNVVLYNFSANNPGSFLHLSNQGTPQIIRHALPKLRGVTKSRIEVDQVEVDGLEIEYFLTLPAHSTKAFPLLVVPHGGPIGVMDTRLFDPVTQYLAHRGFAVLQVNYRGSVGYGKQFIDAGKKQFSSGILRDINEATQRVAKRSDIDQTRMCIMGGSYGGYAALTMPLKYPGLFKCAAAFAAVTDLQLWASPISARTDNMQWLREYVGDPDADSESLRAGSPVYSVSKYALPIMIAHGEDDQTVDVEHFNRMVYALNAANIPHEARLLPGVKHGFSDASARADFYKEMADFISDSLKKR